ncbi:MAG: hypothetical protein ACK5D5_08910 [Bacteroidota bacterium]|jgi:hypothetical protein
MRTKFLFVLICGIITHLSFSQSARESIKIKLYEFSSDEGQLKQITPESTNNPDAAVNENSYNFMNLNLGQIFIHLNFDLKSLARKINVDENTTFNLKITSIADNYNYKTGQSKKSLVRTISLDVRGIYYYLFETLEKERVSNVFKFEIYHKGKVVATNKLDLSLQYGE